MSKVNSIAAERLAGFIQRIEKLMEEAKAIRNDVRDVFSEAKGVGFDVKTMRLILRARTTDSAEADEQAALFDTYAHALGMNVTSGALGIGGGVGRGDPLQAAKMDDDALAVFELLAEKHSIRAIVEETGLPHARVQRLRVAWLKAQSVSHGTDTPESDAAATAAAPASAGSGAGKGVMVSGTSSAACGGASNGASAGVDARLPGHAADADVKPEDGDGGIDGGVEGHAAEGGASGGGVGLIARPSVMVEPEAGIKPGPSIPEPETVLLDGVPTPKATSLPPPTVMALGKLARDGVATVIAPQPSALSRNRPSSDKHFSYASDPSPDDDGMTPPTFLRRGARA